MISPRFRPRRLVHHCRNVRLNFVIVHHRQRSIQDRRHPYINWPFRLNLWRYEHRRQRTRWNIANTTANIIRIILITSIRHHLSRDHASLVVNTLSDRYDLIELILFKYVPYIFNCFLNFSSSPHLIKCGIQNVLPASIVTPYWKHTTMPLKMANSIVKTAISVCLVHHVRFATNPLNRFVQYISVFILYSLNSIIIYSI